MGWFRRKPQEKAPKPREEQVAVSNAIDFAQRAREHNAEIEAQSKAMRDLRAKRGQWVALPEKVRADVTHLAELLRREWRYEAFHGVQAGLPGHVTLTNARKLNGNTGDEQINAKIARVITTVETYGALPDDQRAAARDAISAHL